MRARFYDLVSYHAIVRNGDGSADSPAPASSQTEFASVS